MSTYIVMIYGNEDVWESWSQASTPSSGVEVRPLTAP